MLVVTINYSQILILIKWYLSSVDSKLNVFAPIKLKHFWPIDIFLSRDHNFMVAEKC